MNEELRRELILRAHKYYTTNSGKTLVPSGIANAHTITVLDQLSIHAKELPSIQGIIDTILTEINTIEPLRSWK